MTVLEPCIRGNWKYCDGNLLSVGLNGVLQLTIALETYGKMHSLEMYKGNLSHSFLIVLIVSILSNFFSDNEHQLVLILNRI